MEVIMENLIEYRSVDNSILEELVALFIETFNAEPWNDEWTVATAEKRLSALLNSKEFYGLTAYMNDKLCGFILGWFEQYCNEKEFVIREFAVRNVARGQGIGSKLYNEFEERISKKSIKKITLLTLRGALTEGFYNKNGFQESNSIIQMEKNI
ncbi:MAG: GNAT family N-acetyltransferase [Clostridium sp.]|uniref:GNAT family N-acetyltransferase n=1 Tax=Clostridium sp. TaxID=1506 RepID=UPI001EC831AC|nr:GNAT family N-acetyltransferase [Clostridium sp.]MBS5886465.1 GNAT family N-acetyltransferase [Clostridium sp.]MDU7147716.1 GNAT family N-acetyltransferase [Clostridium sp.]